MLVYKCLQDHRFLLLCFALMFLGKLDISLTTGLLLRGQCKNKWYTFLKCPKRQDVLHAAPIGLLNEFPFPYLLVFCSHSLMMYSYLISVLLY